MKTSSRSDSDKKAYVQIDFTFAVFIFFIVFTSVYTIYKAYENSFDDTLVLTELQGDSRDLCFLLIRSSGSPNNWTSDIENSNFYGWKNINDSSLNATNIGAFNSSSYFTILDSLNLSGFLYLDLTGMQTNTTYLEFGTVNEVGTFFSTYSCYGHYNDEVVRLIVEVWK